MFLVLQTETNNAVVCLHSSNMLFKKVLKKTIQIICTLGIELTRMGCQSPVLTEKTNHTKINLRRKRHWPYYKCVKYIGAWPWGPFVTNKQQMNRVLSVMHIIARNTN